MCLTIPPVIILVYVIALYSFGMYLRFLDFEDYFQCYACKEMDFNNEPYDYIVVGSGSAGSIVARRLAEDKDVKVLLLEAGSGGNSILQIPSVALMLQKSVYDWQYKTVPQKHACLALNNRVSLWPMGKILGGTSMLNSMIYVRGHPEDYARWFRSACDFDYKVDIQPYFDKLENFGDKHINFSVPITELPHKSNISSYFLQAGSCMGYPISDGMNAEPGFSSPKVVMRNGQRWTTYHQLIKQKSPNLKILTNAIVEKVLLRNNTNAYAVVYKHLEQTLVTKAKKGIILSAGTVGTPKILMLSGIGPKEHLKKMKIEPSIDLPVGDNLQDHVTTGLDLLTIDHPPNLGIPQMMSPWSFFKYFLGSGGPWTSGGCEVIAFFNTAKQIAPELQFMILPVGVTSDKGNYLRNLAGIGDKLWNKYFAKITKPSFTILPIVLHPKSRGTVRLKNKNPETPPVIDPNYLSDSYDVDILIQGIDMIKELINTPPMKRLGVKLNTHVFPGCEKFTFDTRPYWECYVRHLTLSSYHPVGTCKMEDVVGQDFQVIGTRQLYVVDGSVLPDLPSGNPNGAIMVMAERAAEIIRHHCWSRRKCCAMELFTKECQC